MTESSRPSPRPVSRFALIAEATLKAALFVMLAAAGGRFLWLLRELDIEWWKGLPVWLLFLAAGLWAGRGALRLRSLLRRPSAEKEAPDEGA